MPFGGNGINFIGIISQSGDNMKKITKFDKFIFLFAFLLFLICFSIAFKQSLMSGTDLFIHNHEALDLSNIIQFKLTYPLYHLMVLVVYKFGKLFFPFLMSLEVASAIVMGLIEVAVYLFTNRVLNQYGVKKSEFVSFMLCIVTAIWLPFYNVNIYLGQGSPNTWHSPTNMVVKPFAMLIFFMVVNLLEKIKTDEEISLKEYILLSFLLILSALAKPSFYQGFIPALFLYIIFALIYSRFQYVKQYFILGFSIVPATILILFQMFSNFFTGVGNSDGGIGIGWFLVPKLYSPNIIISLVLLMGFPICFTFLKRESLKRLDLKLAWIYFIISYLEYGLLYEKGERFAHGNFGWAYSLAALILFIVTTGLFFASFKKEKTQDKILLGVWLLHGISGMLYICILLFIPNIWF